VVAAVVILADDSTWAVLAVAVVVLLFAATLVVGVAVGLAGDGDDARPEAPTGARR
jgi:Na+-transporting NADH:ubiquinone oxidoreductase subunit NqrC